MSISIVSNISAFNARGSINLAASDGVSSVSRLSSGERIVRASDDVSGLATGTSLRTQVTSLRTAIANASQGASLLQVVDGSLSQIVDILQRQKAIAVQAGSGSLTDTNRQLLNQEFQSLTQEIDRIANGTSFNGVSLLSGGLGEKTKLVSTGALASASIRSTGSLNNATIITASTDAIQAFDSVTGASRRGTAAAGDILFVDSTGAALTNGAFENVDSAVYGQFSSFTFSDLNYGGAGVGSATLTGVLNGVEFSGKVIAGAGNPVILRNGNTYIRLTLSAGAVSLADAGAASRELNNIIDSYSRTTILRTSTVEGVNYEGTALDGVIGGTVAGSGVGNASIRLAGSGAVDIRNFRYEGNEGTSGSNILSVEVNGRAFVARGVNDAIVDSALNDDSGLQFYSANGTEALRVSIEGLAVTISNIRTNVSDRKAFVDALNIGFARSGKGLDFALGANGVDKISVRYGSASSTSLYGGNVLDVTSTASATAASSVLDNAINQVIALRANVGALQSRFSFASITLQSSLESQDSARGSYLDTDVALESTRFASSQVQLQAGVSILAQANLLPSGLLSLLDVSSLLAN